VIVNALSKANMAESLTLNFNLNKTDAKVLVDNFFEVLRLALESGNHVKISRFGNFVLRDKPERPGRNPRTGEMVPVMARRVVTFRAGLKLKSMIQVSSKISE